jgi:eukaryotic-like serine/threonine-protein kinase
VSVADWPHWMRPLVRVVRENCRKARQLFLPRLKQMPTLTKAGRYEICGELGRGAMGVVYHATDPVIGRTVAVKTLLLSEEGTGLTRAELLAKFQTEARAAGLLTHPNIVVIFDAGEEDGLFFITMELVEGKSLQNLLDAGQMFPLPRVLRIIEQTCSALQFAHDRNIVHRDIKPANLMLTPDDTVKVTDFGTAKILQFGTVQQTAHVVGTPSYMSPEQIKGKVVDGRSDIFSLGVVLYEMVTGEKPFPGQNITTVIYKIVNEEPTAPRDIDSSIHPGLNDVIMKALAKEPAARYQSCRELFEDLRNYRSLSSVSNPNATLPAVSASQNSQSQRGYSDSAQIASASRALASRASGPTQTPVVRRTGTIPAAPEPEKNNVFATVLAAILLLAVIVFGVQRIRPVFQAARQQNRGSNSGSGVSQATAPSDPAATNMTLSTTTESAPPSNVSAEISAEPAPEPSSAKSAERAASRSALVTSNLLSPAAAEYKDQILQIATERRLRDRLYIKGSGMTLMLSGKLRPVEHSELLKFLREAPAGIQVIDDIQFDDTSNAPSSGEDSPKHQRNQLQPLAQGLLVTSEPAGADVFINGDKQSGQTPLTLPLAPGKYNVVLRLQGYDAYSGSVQVRDDAQEKVEAALHQKNGHVAWAQVESTPAGAEIWVDGVSTGQRTPARVEISSGIRNITLKLNGYRASRSAIEASEGGTVNVSPTLQRIR